MRNEMYSVQNRNKNAVPIRIRGTGSYLPGDPVGPDRVEEILGRLEGLPEQMANRAEKLRERMLNRSGVDARYFAIDPNDRRQTETSVSMAEKACRRALEASEMEPDGVELLISSNMPAEGYTPPSSSLIQERLGIRKCVEIDILSNCTGVAKGVQIAIDMLRQGRYQTALFVYSQLSSIFLRTEFLNINRLKLETLVLRWMLSDGAGALVLTRGDHDGPEIIDAYVESLGYDREPGMTMMLGAGVGPQVANQPCILKAVYDEGLHHLCQDVKEVMRSAPELAIRGLRRMLDGLGLHPGDVTRFILPIPGRHFLTKAHRELFLDVMGFLDEERVPFWVNQTGYCGGATSLVQFDCMARKGQFQSGDLIALYAAESSKWMSGGFLVRWTP